MWAPPSNLHEVQWGVTAEFYAWILRLDKMGGKGRPFPKKNEVKKNKRKEGAAKARMRRIDSYSSASDPPPAPLAFTLASSIALYAQVPELVHNDDSGACLPFLERSVVDLLSRRRA